MTMEDKQKATIISMAMLTGCMLIAFICSALVTENLRRSKHDQSHSKKCDVEQQAMKNPETNSEVVVVSPEPESKAAANAGANPEAIVIAGTNPETVI